MYKEKVTITSIDVDSNLELKLSSLFKIMQVVASNHVATLHASHKDLIQHNMLWVVIRMDVKIYKTPVLDDEIVVTTHPGETRSFIFHRFFEIYDNKGKLIMSASSMWALIDKTTRRVVLKPEGFVKIAAESNKDDLPLPDKIVVDSLIEVDQRTVRYSEIDLNGHLNNTSYIEFVEDIHQVDFFKENRVTEIIVNYDKEIKAGDKVSLLSNNSSPEIIRGEVEGNSHFTAKLVFEKR